MSKINKLVWIDDSERCMKEVVGYIFSDLWEENIRSEILIIGDDADHNHNIDHRFEIDDLNRVTYDKFISFLIAEGYIEDKKEIISHWELINNTIPLKDGDEDKIIPQSNIASEHMDILDNNSNVVNAWKSLNNNVITSDEYSVEKIVIGILDLIGENNDYSNVMIMLDLCLLDGDYRKLSSDQNDIPVFSMAMYNELIKKCPVENVGLYSTYVVPNDIVKKWEDIYMFQFDKNAQIKVYNRKGKLLPNNSQGTLIEYIKGRV